MLLETIAQKAKMGTIYEVQSYFKLNILSLKHRPFSSLEILKLLASCNNNVLKNVVYYGE